MAMTLDPVKNWWQQRLDREKRVIAGGVVLLVLCFLYWLIIPRWSDYAELKQQRQALMEELSWMYEQTPLIQQLANSCNAPIAEAEQPPATRIQNIARRFQIREPRVTTVSTNGFRIDVASASGNAALRFTRELACAGFGLKALKLQRTGSDQDTVSVAMELELAG